MLPLPIRGAAGPSCCSHGRKRQNHVVDGLKVVRELEHNWGKEEKNRWDKLPWIGVYLILLPVTHWSMMISKGKGLVQKVLSDKCFLTDTVESMFVQTWIVLNTGKIPRFPCCHEMPSSSKATGPKQAENHS